MIRSRAVAMAAIAFLFLAQPCGAAQESCRPPFDAEGVVTCALSVSPEVRIARSEFDALRGRRTSASIWLPGNPNLAFSADERQPWEDSAGESTFNWYATLSQEVEIAGQRGARLRVVDAEMAAQLRRFAVTELDVAAQTLRSFVELEAAEEEVKLAERLGQIADSLSRLADERAKGGLLSGVDADVAKSESARIGLARYAAQRRYSAALANLNVLLGRDADEPIRLSGGLVSAGTIPIEAQSQQTEFVNRALLLRGEIPAAEAERSVLNKQLELLRRQRIPNPTLSIFAQRDGFNERVLGGGISIPIPLPAPIGQTRAGEIEEALARINQAGSNIDLVRRRVRIEAAQAYSEWRAWSAAMNLFPPDLVKRSSNDLVLISDAIGSRQLSLREALLSQRSLIDLLSGEIETRRNNALARVNLMRMGGFALPGMER